jgi:DNA-binding NarL/FixJ family response regulator
VSSGIAVGFAPVPSSSGRGNDLSEIDLSDAAGAPARASSLVLLGRAGVTRDVVSHTLRSAGLELIDLAALERDAGHQVVAVIVRPNEEDWVEAERLSADAIAILNTDNDDEIVEAVIRGAEAVITTRSDPAELVDAVSIVADGGSVLQPDIARKILRHLREMTAQRPVLTLTPRETDILLSIERGDSIKQTARALGISEKTVQNLQSRLFNKLRARNRAQAISRAHELGLLRTVWTT